MSNFTKGQCVRLSGWLGNKTQEERKLILSSVHILSQTDIQRGYYYTSFSGGKSFDLLNCVSTKPDTFRCKTYNDMTIRGKVTQPVSTLKYLKNTHTLHTSTHYIKFKGVKTKVIGYLSGNVLYFRAIDGVYYKTKIYVTEDLYVVGFGCSNLTDKQKKLCHKI